GCSPSTTLFRYRRRAEPPSQLRAAVDIDALRPRAKELASDRGDQVGRAVECSRVGGRRLALHESTDRVDDRSIVDDATGESGGGAHQLVVTFGVARAPKCTYSSPVGRS